MTAPFFTSILVLLCYQRLTEIEREGHEQSSRRHRQRRQFVGGYRGEYSVHLVPVKIIFDEQSSRDGVDLTPTQPYEMLTQAPELPTEKVLSRFQLGEFYLTELTAGLGARTGRGTLGLGWYVG